MFLGTDFRRKYIIADINGEEVLIEFYDSFWHGVYRIRVLGARDAKIKNAYPGFVRRIQERTILIRLFLERLFSKKGGKKNG